MSCCVRLLARPAVGGGRRLCATGGGPGGLTGGGPGKVPGTSGGTGGGPGKVPGTSGGTGGGPGPGAGPGKVPGKVRVHATTAGGRAFAFAAPVGLTLMEAIRDCGRLDIEAACDGTCACSTCHVILSEQDYRKLGEPSEDEMDMLDLAPAVTKTSRLSCQVNLTEELDGITLQMPDETNNQLGG